MDILRSCGPGSGTGISQEVLSACTALCFFPAAMRLREAALCMCSIVREYATRGALYTCVGLMADEPIELMHCRCGL